MIIGALRLTFAVPTEVSSRSIAQNIKDRLWARFRISVAQLDSPSTNEVIIGAALVGADEKQTQTRIDRILHFFNKESATADLVDNEVEMIRFDDIELERDFQKYNP